MSITRAATATRDLANMVEKGALKRTGERCYARYWAPIVLGPVGSISIDERGAVRAD